MPLQPNDKPIVTADNKPEIDGIVGCTDGGCVFGHPGGMHTNGGCGCLKTIPNSELRRRLAKNILLYRNEIKRLKEYEWMYTELSK